MSVHEQDSKPQLAHSVFSFFDKKGLKINKMQYVLVQKQILDSQMTPVCQNRIRLVTCVTKAQQLCLTSPLPSARNLLSPSTISGLAVLYPPFYYVTLHFGSRSVMQ